MRNNIIQRVGCRGTNILDSQKSERKTFYDRIERKHSEAKEQKYFEVATLEQ